AALLGAALFAWLRYAASPGRERAGSLSLAAFAWAPAALSALNLLAIFRPPAELETPSGIAELSLVGVASGLWSAPLVWALGHRAAPQRGRHLLAAFALYALLLLVPVYGALGPPSAAATPLVGRSEARPPSILLIVVDTLRSDAVAPFGGDPELTPNIR